MDYMPAGAVIVSTHTGKTLMSTGNAWMEITVQRGPLIPVPEDVFAAAERVARHG